MSTFHDLCHFEVITVCSFLAPMEVLNLSRAKRSYLQLRTDQMLWRELHYAHFGPELQHITRRANPSKLGWHYEYFWRRNLYVSHLKQYEMESATVLEEGRKVSKGSVSWTQSPVRALLLRHALKRNIPFRWIKDVLMSMMDIHSLSLSEVLLHVIGEGHDQLRQLLPALVNAYFEAHSDEVTALGFDEDSLFMVCSVVTMTEGSDYTLETLTEALNNFTSTGPLPVEFVKPLHALMLLSEPAPPPIRKSIGEWALFSPCDTIRSKLFSKWKARYVFMKMTHLVIVKDGKDPNGGAVISATLVCPQPWAKVSRKQNIVIVSSSSSPLEGTRGAEGKQVAFPDKEIQLRFPDVDLAFKWQTALQRVLCAEPQMYPSQPWPTWTQEKQL